MLKMCHAQYFIFSSFVSFLITQQSRNWGNKEKVSFNNFKLERLQMVAKLLFLMFTTQCKDNDGKKKKEFAFKRKQSFLRGSSLTFGQNRKLDSKGLK